MRVIGLTGSFGTGKSTVAAMFTRCGAKVLDADKVVHRLLEKDRSSRKKIIKFFGKDIVSKGKIDRRKLGAVVFHSPSKLKRLEKILHPAVQEVFKKELKNIKKRDPKATVVLDIPLLFESKRRWPFKSIVVVKTTRANQLKRAARKFHLTPREALRRITKQMPLKDKIRRADFIIDNNKSKRETKKQVKRLWQKWQ